METIQELLPSNTKNGLFRKLIGLGIDDDLVKKTMCFWMFLESKDFKGIYDKLYLASPRDFGHACAEAEMVLASLKPDQISTATEYSPIPCHITSTLLGPNISLVHIFQDQEKVYDDILAFHDRVCNMTFEGTLEDNASSNGNNAQGIDGENTNVEEAMHNSTNASLGLVCTQQPPTSKLNPFAKEWTPLTEGPSLDDRSLFMTFSRGHPLSRSEIVNYFERNYGNCIEEIFIYVPRDREAEFGKITFKFSSIPRVVLKDKEFAKIYIGHKTLCLKKYNPN